MVIKFLTRNFSLNNIGEDRDTPKRKLEDAQLAADDGSSKKMFLGETVSSASNDHVIEKETRLKQNENTDTSLNSNVESSSMERERNTSDDRLTKEGKMIDITPVYYLKLNILKHLDSRFWINH